ncbi:TIGR04255 family protein [Actinokineospora xionganensis]|uniref:TIGR04255 family protein n=1 Tax=Actinokineospora xionganensis TaxID=2684470 RepID=A0ABR7LDA2_9PSEU|nr:TIGR04255 family protein [Actinokineospora xionganensis]MBC6450686.1 TIGR04255 family protein [Actinokineospora xionganensis]
MTNSPLQLVVCQVRHERNLAVADVTKALAIREALGDYKLEEARQQQIEFLASPEGVSPLSTPLEQHGWRLRSRDVTGWTVSLRPESFALESSGYTSWTDFRDRLEPLVRAVHEHLKPAAELRLGLRYIDRIKLPDIARPLDWQGYIDDRLLGPLLNTQLGASIRGQQQAVQLQGPNGSQVLLRHGVEADDSGGWPYVLDTDCSRGDSRAFDADDVLEGAHSLHRLALQIFQTAVTPALIKRLIEGEAEHDTHAGANS